MKSTSVQDKLTRSKLYESQAPPFELGDAAVQSAVKASVAKIEESECQILEFNEQEDDSADQSE